ncbi:MAG: sulfatase-like hydrolase/transferase [Bryobacterales bacterium]|nr:sulfatase-like hydrolase/transferase [Bryobacterales bacterium]
MEREGLAENTLVFFMGDNGNCQFRGKPFLYEGGNRVPLIVRGPGIGKGAVRDDPVSSLDVTAATLVTAGIGVPPTLHGRGLFSAGHTARTHVFAARDRCDVATERMRCVLDGGTLTYGISCRRFLICGAILTKNGRIRRGIWRSSFTGRGS